jgi:transposase
MNQSIGEMDRQIDGLEKKYPEISVLRTAPGVGPVVAVCYVLTLDRAEAMETNRQAGAYLGLRPRQQQSGDSNPQRGIAKTGNSYLRSLLVHSGPLWPRLGAAPLGTQAGRQRRKTRQETRHRCRGPQAGGGAAQHVAQPQDV